MKLGDLLGWVLGAWISPISEASSWTRLLQRSHMKTVAVTAVSTALWTLDHLKYIYILKDSSFAQTQLGTDGAEICPEGSVTKEISYTVGRNPNWNPEIQKSTVKSRNPLWNPEIHCEIQKSNLKSRNPFWNPEIHSKIRKSNSGFY